MQQPHKRSNEDNLISSRSLIVVLEVFIKWTKCAMVSMESDTSVEVLFRNANVCGSDIMRIGPRTEITVIELWASAHFEAC